MPPAFETPLLLIVAMVSVVIAVDLKGGSVVGRQTVILLDFGNFPLSWSFISADHVCRPKFLGSKS